MNALRNCIVGGDGEAAYFFTGKYDLSKRNMPYSALGSAFNQIVDQVHAFQFSPSDNDVFISQSHKYFNFFVVKNNNITLDVRVFC